MMKLVMNKTTWATPSHDEIGNVVLTLRMMKLVKEYPHSHDPIQ